MVRWGTRLFSFSIQIGYCHLSLVARSQEVISWTKRSRAMCVAKSEKCDKKLTWRTRERLKAIYEKLVSYFYFWYFSHDSRLFDNFFNLSLCCAVCCVLCQLSSNFLNLLLFLPFFLQQLHKINRIRINQQSAFVCLFLDSIKIFLSRQWTGLSAGHKRLNTDHLFIFFYFFGQEISLSPILGEDTPWKISLLYQQSQQWNCNKID